ncbi:MULTISPECIES: M2 family metallopeptidase [unclassified Colwellia]|uniref:M2 family metallopeptidase n=1 Tax=unclassified Colwellia TaxID=196834 RepID=UPI0015F73041|nr:MULTISPECIES: M2 family metallopeptidase [unclassified Colwellia]MBA6231938.1 M2 family metallopeptidase [Colwellia sp. MB02u-7]MBA6235889.1 M2 family metallopeptidase [Colwellia sp. MB02u-11]MBA6255275.1 M2 family metallopeptidase [Colwellia sp. MB3u-28]MBA6258560.1 M2 family metallopeptidase [Colwellia sp. MB3u-41]MBA6298696.1 M2 family metallopeptidase [Colwellia sp. MB3u-22]
MIKLFKQTSIALCVLASLSACNNESTSKTQQTPKQVAPVLTAKDADAFLIATEKELIALGIEGSRAEWIYSNFITDDTAALSAAANQKSTEAGVRFAMSAAKFDHIEVTENQRRKLNTLKQSLVMPAPQDSEKSAELAKIGSELGGMYGKGTYTTKAGKTLSLGEMTSTMATSRDYDELLEMWQGWRTISPDMKPLFIRQSELGNEGAQGLGYKDLGTMWRSNYDMPADDFAKELDRLWGQVKPLYDDLHCYVRGELAKTYGADKVPQDQPIPAHLLGNMWAQSWGNIYELVAPENADPGYDVTEQLAAKDYDEINMVKGAETFFTSLGFDELPETFWTRSLFTKPADRDVVCHASAWDLDAKDDIRIKMCIQKTGEEFNVIHHELGHNFYQRAYKDQPVYFQNSANDGFHEAIGDTIALSVTPKYLKEIGLIDTIPDESKDIGLLMKMALEKIAFIPFGLMVDQWRWKVYSGEITPENYNTAWWELREKYQGVAAPIAREANAFDPGAKYHVPGGVPYSRYFLAHIQQFEFHKALCEVSGNTDPIHRCSIYNSKEAGKALNTVLEMGSSQPWQEAYKVLTGSEQMDATAVLDYFDPLHVWLKEKNKGKQCGF